MIHIFCSKQASARFIAFTSISLFSKVHISTSQKNVPLSKTKKSLIRYKSQLLILKQNQKHLIKTYISSQKKIGNFENIKQKSEKEFKKESEEK